jgi:hypothetical protein
MPCAGRKVEGIAGRCLDDIVVHRDQTAALEYIMELGPEEMVMAGVRLEIVLSTLIMLAAGRMQGRRAEHGNRRAQVGRARDAWQATACRGG